MYIVSSSKDGRSSDGFYFNSGIHEWKFRHYGLCNTNVSQTYSKLTSCRDFLAVFRLTFSPHVNKNLKKMKQTLCSEVAQWFEPCRYQTITLMFELYYLLPYWTRPLFMKTWFHSQYLPKSKIRNILTVFKDKSKYVILFWKYAQLNKADIIYNNNPRALHILIRWTDTCTHSRLTGLTWLRFCVILSVFLNGRSIYHW